MDQSRFFSGTEVQRKNRTSSKDLHSWLKENVAKPISNIDGFVKHVYRERNQEADHWANIGAQGHRKIVLDKRTNSETWKAVKGFLGRQFQRQWQWWMWCGDQRVDREKRGTISKIAIPLNVGTAMAAEIAGVCVVRGFFDLIFCECLCVKNVNLCINSILNK